MQDGLRSWLKVDHAPPFLEHLSFRLGNQFFFIRIEDEDGDLPAPGNRGGLFSVARRCQGHPYLMPMRRRGARWEPVLGG